VWVAHCGSSETQSSDRLSATFSLPVQLEAEQPGAPLGACDVIIWKLLKSADVAFDSLCIAGAVFFTG